MKNHPRPHVFVFEVRGVNQDLLFVFGGEVAVFEEDGGLVFRVFVQPDFADAEHVGQVEELVEAEKVGDLTLKGFARPVTAYNVFGMKG